MVFILVHEAGEEEKDFKAIKRGIDGQTISKNSPDGYVPME